MDVPRAHLLIGALGIKDRQTSTVRITAGSGQWPLGAQSWAEDGDRAIVGQGVDPVEHLGMAEGGKGTVGGQV